MGQTTFLILLIFLTLLFTIEAGIYKIGQANDNYVLLNRQKRDTKTNFTVNDEHDYYNSSIISNGPLSSQYLFFFKDALKDHLHDIFLSNASRSFRQVSLPFPFYFYGHEVTQVLVTTGGFIHMDSYSHPYLTHSQYVAPLMADFSPKLHNDSHVYYKGTNDYFIVYWKNIYLAYNDTNSTADDSPYSFHLALFPNGSILFHYEKIPVSPVKINDNLHKVTIGVADAYFYVTSYYRYIVNYHRVSLNLSLVAKDSLIILKPLPTCHQLSTCGQCIQPGATKFKCSWCFSANRCSSGVDRQLQDWENQKCNVQEVTSDCVPPKNPSTTATASNGGGLNGPDGKADPLRVLLIIFLVVVALIAIGCLIYMCVWAHKHPNSKIGMWFIKNRPAVLFSKCRNCCKNTGENHSRMQEDLSIGYNPYAEDPSRDHVGGAKFPQFDDIHKANGVGFKNTPKGEIYGANRKPHGDESGIASGATSEIYDNTSDRNSRIGYGDRSEASSEIYSTVGEPHSAKGTHA